MKHFTSFLAKEWITSKWVNLYIVVVKEWLFWNCIEIPQKILKLIKHKKLISDNISEEEIITKLVP